MRKTKRLNVTHDFIMKIPNKRELQQITSNHLSDIDFKGLMKLCKGYTKEPQFCHQIIHYHLGRTYYNNQY